jgi:CheY-like chemotaxis protein
MKILIIEDDHFYSVNLKELLEDNGYEVFCAETAQDALTSSLDEYSAIISDVMLPNDPALTGLSVEETRSGFQTGIALFRKFRREGFTKPLLLISASGTSGESATWAISQGVPFIAKEDGPSQILTVLEKLGLKGTPPPPRAFIVHGHDDSALAELKDYLQNTLKWQEPVVLREQPSRGKTIIEKFEELAGRIDCVFVLLTPDDKGINLSTDDEKRRARQNVIFELGFFYARMGRESGRVIALRKGAMELPSDIHGIIWIDITNGVKSAGEDIRKEVSYI